MRKILLEEGPGLTHAHVSFLLLLLLADCYFHLDHWVVNRSGLQPVRNRIRLFFLTICFYLALAHEVRNSVKVFDNYMYRRSTRENVSRK